jgi:DNA-binding transcriptional LysR family regulator
MSAPPCQLRDAARARISLIIAGQPCKTAGMIDWNDYRYFVAVARAGTLAVAARALKVDQTTCGRRLQALEEALGARLFDRTPEGLVLTAAGERALERAREIEEAALALERQVAGEDARIEGVVRLATSETMAVGFLVQALAGLRARHAGIALQVVTGSATVNLLKREADVAVRIAPRPTQANLMVRRLGEAGWSLYASRDYFARRPLDGTLASHALIGFDEEMAQIPAARWMDEHLPAGRVLETNSILAVLEAVRAGLGIGALPCFLGDAVPTLARAGSERIAVADVWMVVHPDLERTPRIRVVMDFLVEQFTAVAARFRGE